MRVLIVIYSLSLYLFSSTAADADGYYCVVCVMTVDRVVGGHRPEDDASFS